MDNNMAFIKRKLDHEINDKTRKILEQTANYNSQNAGSANAEAQENKHILDHLKSIKLPKHHKIKGIIDRKNMSIQHKNYLRTSEIVVE